MIETLILAWFFKPLRAKQINLKMKQNKNLEFAKNG